MIFKVGEKRIEYFTKYRVSEFYNAICGTFELTGVKDTDGISGERCQLLFDNGDLIMDCYVNSVTVSDEVSPTEPNVSGCSEAGILAETHIAQADYPLEVRNYNLEDIIRKITGRYQFGYRIFDADYNDSLKPFDKVDLDMSQTLEEIIKGLALQRGLFLTHAADGTDSTLQLTGRPLASAKIYDYWQYVENWTVAEDYSAMHREITVVMQSSDKHEGGKFTIINEYCPVFKARTEAMKDGNPKDIEAYAKKILASELLGIEATFNCRRWIPIGNILPFKDREWFITEASIEGDSTGESYSYKAVLKQVYEV